MQDTQRSIKKLMLLPIAVLVGLVVVIAVVASINGISILGLATGASQGQTTPLSLGVAPENGSIGSDKEQDYWTFTPKIGQELLVVVKAASTDFQPSIDLFNSDGQVVIYNDGGPGGTSTVSFIVKGDGEHKAQVWSFTGTKGDYSVNLVEKSSLESSTGSVMSLEGTKIEKGKSEAGEVSVPGEFKHIFFSGTKGEKVYISMSADSGTFEPSLDLFAANGTNLTYDDGPVGGTASITYDLPSDGDYKLKLWSYSNTTGSYKVSFHDDPSSAPVSGNKADGSSDQVSSVQSAEGLSGSGNLDKGEIKNGDLVTQVDLPKGAQHEYIFEGKKGQKITASMTAGSDSLAPSLDLFIPGKIPSVYVDGKYGKSATIDELLFLGSGKVYELPEDGTYTLMAWSYVGSTGKYDLSLKIEEAASNDDGEKSENTSNQPKETPQKEISLVPGATIIGDGDVVTADLNDSVLSHNGTSKPGKYYVFYANKGQYVTATMDKVTESSKALEGLNPKLEIFGPGVDKYDWESTLPSINWINGNAGEFYWFNVDGGRVKDAAGQQPDMTTYYNARLSGLRIEKEGFYVIIAGTNAALGEKAPYELSLSIQDQIPGDFKGQLTPNADSVSEISNYFDRDLWALEGKSGEFASIFIKPIGEYIAPDIYIYDPDGKVVFKRIAKEDCSYYGIKYDGNITCKNGTSLDPFKFASTGTYTLAVAGTHYFTNEDKNDGMTGEYSLSVDMSDTIPGIGKGTIAFGGTNQGDLSLPGEKHVYTFEGVKDEDIVLIAIPGADSKLVPKIEVYNPDFSLFASGVGVVDTTQASSVWNNTHLELPVTGTYYVRIADNSDATGSYIFSYPNKVRNTGYVGKGISNIDPETGCGTREYRDGSWNNIYHDGVYRGGGDGGLGRIKTMAKVIKSHDGTWREDYDNQIYYYPSGRIKEAAIDGKTYIYPDEGKIYDLLHIPGRFGSDLPSKYDGLDPERPELPLWVTNPDSADSLGLDTSAGETLWREIDITTQKGPWPDWDQYKAWGFEIEWMDPVFAIGDDESGWKYVRTYNDELPVYHSTQSTLVTSTTTDVGFWDFVRTKRNSIADGRPWGIYGNIEYGVSTLTLKQPTDRHGKDASFGAVAGVYLGPQTDKKLGNIEYLKRDAFTVALRTNPDGISKEPINGAHNSEWDYKDWENHSPERILLTGGPYYRWLLLSVNANCNLEVGFNNAGGANFPAIFVSDAVVSLDEWHDIIVSVNLPEKQLAVTIDGITELFAIPTDFQWDFEYDYNEGTSDFDVDDPIEIDNQLGMTHGGGAGYFQGDLDWMYVANGVLDPSKIDDRIKELRKSPPPRDTSIKSATLNDSNSFVEVVVDPVTWEVWNYSGSSDPGERQIVMEKIYDMFDDQFDWVFIVNNNSDTSNFKPDYMGRFHGVRNEVLGIGYDVEEPTESYDTKKLRGMIHFPWRGAISGGPSLHELMHTWGNASIKAKMLDFDEGGEEATSGSHWGISNIGGQLGGFDMSTFKELPMDTTSAEYVDGYRHYQAGFNGTGFGMWANGGNSVPFSNFELYLMGLIPSSEIEDIVYFEEFATSSASSFYECGGFDAEGSGCFSARKKIQMTADQIVEKLGKRFPSSEDSQKEFSALTVVITPEEMTEGERKEVHDQVSWFSNPVDDGKYLYNFSEATGNRATIKMDELNKALKSYEPPVETSGIATSTPSVQGN